MNNYPDDSAAVSNPCIYWKQTNLQDIVELAKCQFYFKPSASLETPGLFRRDYCSIAYAPHPVGYYSAFVSGGYHLKTVAYLHIFKTESMQLQELVSKAMSELFMQTHCDLLVLVCNRDEEARNLWEDLHCSKGNIGLVNADTRKLALFPSRALDRRNWTSITQNHNPAAAGHLSYARQYQAFTTNHLSELKKSKPYLRTRPLRIRFNLLGALPRLFNRVRINRMHK